uniref:HTH CENPB-type domain-containing protein n=1 Tax=Chlorocebus sabaeus TaxID=60711 RepID=A0A0D9RQQ9_CHLSB
IDSKCSSEKKIRTSLTLNQKLQMIKLSEEGMSNTRLGGKLILLLQLSKKIKNATSELVIVVYSCNPSTFKGQGGAITVWIEDQTSQNIPLSQNQIQNKVLTVSSSMKPERGEEASEEKLKTSKGWFMGFKERSHLHNYVQGKVAGIDVEATSSYLDDLAKIIDECGYTKQQIFSGNKTVSYQKKIPFRTFTITEKKSIPVLQSFKRQADSCYRIMQLVTYKLKPMLIHFQTPRILKNHAESIMPVLYKFKKKKKITANLVTTWFTKCFQPIIESYCSKKKKILLPIDNAHSHSKALTEMYKKINVLMPTNTTSILAHGSRIISAFNSQCLRNTFCEVITAFASDSSLDPLKTFWKRNFTTLDVIKDMLDSWEEVKISILTGVAKKFIPNFKGFKTSVEEVADVVEIARELGLQVEPEGVTELLPISNEELHLRDEQRKWFVEMECTLVEDSVNKVERTAKDSGCLNLFDKAAAGLERSDYNFER